MTDYVMEVALKIEALKKDVKAGVFVPKGREDILAKALGKAEHPGRVRGVPNGIGIAEYFGKAPENPTPTQLKEKINNMELQMKEIQMLIIKYWQTGERPSEEEIARSMNVMSNSTQGSTSCASMEGSQSHLASKDSPHDEPSLIEKPSELTSEKPPSDVVFRTLEATIPSFPMPTLHVNFSVDFV